MWEDNWTPCSGLLRPVAAKSCNPPIWVHELIDSTSNQWRMDMLHQFFYEMDIEAIKNIPLSSMNQSDFWAWHYEKNGSFSVRSAYRMLILWDRSRRPEGGEWEPIKISSKFEPSAYIPKLPKPSNVLTKVWSSYWKANPTQKVSNKRAKPRSKSEANRKNCRTDLPGPVWPVPTTGLTGRVCSKTSRPVLPTGLTGGTQKTPENLDSNDESQPNDHENRWNLGGLLRPYPVNISPKDLVPKINESWELWGRSKGIGVFSRTQEIEFEQPGIPEGLGQG